MAFVIDDTVEIDAPAEVVWKVLTDLGSYGEWNPFVAECRSTLEPGDPIEMQVRLGSPKPRKQVEYVRTHTPGTEFSYSMKPVPLGILHSLRSHTVTPLDNGRTRYRSHFELGGLLRPVVTLALGKALHSGFGGMTAAVKERAESLR
ncbi:SRPBCC domain-containing protein [Nocardia aobensis]|uniref:SRPBCC domain-containing protein n=1 Tax=Nocardia aobensis TaxID=257277 RepID=UPI0003191B27|nr:SRPBCC domain-containing protein [Nocardia aobensis]